MKIEVNCDGAVGSKAPWNKDKIIGPKPPLRTKNVWSPKQAPGRRKPERLGYVQLRDRQQTARL
jgi:hypothetical protein